jgi:hypothetical protein
MLVRGTRLDACSFPVVVLGIVLTVAWSAITHGYPWPIMLAAISSFAVLNRVGPRPEVRTHPPDAGSA